MNKTYNGWSNYATWKLNLEVLETHTFFETVSVDDLKQIVERTVFDDLVLHSGSHLVERFARAFMEEVNFFEIAEAINDEIILQRDVIAG